MTDVHAFLEDYRTTWEAVCLGNADNDALTAFFATPCFMVDLEGAITLYAEESDIRVFNETRRDAFQDDGVTACRFRGVDVQSQGPHLALAVVNWELLTASGDVERAWRHYYTIQCGAARCQILVSAFQTGS